jgi:hypothetical protein
LNWLARCAGVTRSVNLPLAPSGIGRMRHHSRFAAQGSAPPVGMAEQPSYFHATGCMKASAARRKSWRDGQCCARLPCRREDVHSLQRAGPPKERCVDIALISAAIVVGLFAAYNLFHYMLFLLVTHPRDAGDIGHALNEFEERQLVEWTPKAEDFLKHDDENRTYDDVFGRYRGEHDNYSTCVFPRAAFTQPYDA